MLLRRASLIAVRSANKPPSAVIARRFVATPVRPEPVRVRLPENDAQGVHPRSIPKWFKKEGDEVKSGEPLCEVDAGDVVYDFNSPVSGWVVRITAKEGSVDLKGEFYYLKKGAKVRRDGYFLSSSSVSGVHVIFFRQ